MSFASLTILTALPPPAETGLPTRILFKAPTYFIPESRFEELVDYLQGRIDNSILGRVNAKRGIPNYESYDEYVMQHMGAAAAAA